jgi:phosphoribosyl 1,2-cyclic phosphodiesterase
MKIKFYGVRGSIPVPGKEFLRYGGNTTCICLKRELAKRIGIIDAGTGIRKLGKELVASGVHQSVINIVFSHFHWDHIQGFPFFAPAYDKNQTIGLHIIGRKKAVNDLKDLFSHQMQREYFPVDLDGMGAHFEFLSFVDSEDIYGSRVIAMPQFHKQQGGSFGFRIEDESRVVVICTDIEHINGIDQNIVQLAKNADTLIHDGQYTPEEYKKFKGWGHSTWEHAVEVAKQANVKQLIITHHDPDHDDDFLDEMEATCQRAFPDSLFAKEGMEVNVGEYVPQSAIHLPQSTADSTLPLPE